MTPNKIPNVYAYRGRHLLGVYHKRNNSYFEGEDPDIIQICHPKTATSDLPVCIIGAGMAGLYTAMILDSLEIPYKIIEANTPGRFGRIFTYHFTSGGPYDYFDVGAMRFPDTPFMKRLFDLIENRGLQNIKLIPYTQSDPNTWLFFNDARLSNQDTSAAGDPFNVKGSIADETLTTPAGVAEKISEVLRPFRDLFRPPPPGGQERSIEESMSILLNETNNYSARGYMTNAKGMAQSDVRWCETLDKSTGWYDRGFAETIIESLAFNWPSTPLPGPENPGDPNAGWYCFDGGSSTLPRAMFASLSEERRRGADFNTRVTAIARDGNIMKVSTTTDECQDEREYSAVISTVPLPRLKLMDLTGTDINANYTQWSAIRELQYASAIKIGMKFSSAWWAENPQPISGGSSFTDLPLRTIVYPSYPENATEETRSKVLIASYCWTQDADQVGSLIHSDGTVEPELLNSIFRNLAAVHGLEVSYIRQYYQGEYFAWDWQHQPLTMGAYAFFGPGVYDEGGVYCEITQPAANGKLFFAGEATSSAHPWVSGALDSAWRAVDQYLAIHNPELREKFQDLWGHSEYMDEEEDETLVKKNSELMEKHLKLAFLK